MRNVIGYYGKKLLIFIISIAILSVAVFYISRLAPGDPLVSFYGDRAEKMSPQEREWAEARLGLDEPIGTQYVKWLKNALKGDFGISYKYKTDVLRVIGGRITNTLILGGLGFAVIFVLALALGLLCALNEERPVDKLICRIGTFTSCIPEFWLSIVLILIFSVSLKWLPASGAYTAGGSGSIADRAKHLVLPMAVVTISHVWYYAYIIRSRLLEEVRQDYVIMAKAKGLSRKKILLRHCLPNAIPAFISIMAVSVPHVLGGTYIVETVFSYPGIGTLAYESARYQDYNLLMVLCLFTGAVVIFFNLLGQIINERIDPRLKAERVPAAGEVTGLEN